MRYTLWRIALAYHVWRARCIYHCFYGTGLRRLWRYTSDPCWLEWFNEGVSARDAVNEDLTNI